MPNSFFLRWLGRKVTRYAFPSCAPRLEVPSAPSVRALFAGIDSRPDAGILVRSYDSRVMTGDSGILMLILSRRDRLKRRRVSSRILLARFEVSLSSCRIAISVKSVFQEFFSGECATTAEKSRSGKPPQRQGVLKSASQS